MAAELTQHELNDLQQRLKARYAETRKEISAELLRSDEERYANLADAVRDSGDDALADVLVDIELAAVDRHVQEIRAIDAALLRIADGSYGVCSDCEAPISVERLQAQPTAQRCVICQEVHDRTYAHPEHASY